MILTARLFAQGARRLANASQKQAFLAALEAEVWDLPSALFEGAGDDEWELRALAAPEARSALERAVAAATARDR